MIDLRVERAAVCSKSAERRRRGAWSLTAFALTLALSLPMGVTAQLASAAASSSLARTAPRVFLECEAGIPCDAAMIQGDISWVDWLPDSESAQVLVTVRGNGPTEGGAESGFVLDFVGQGTMGHLTDQLTLSADSSQDPSLLTEGIVQTIALGLLRYGVEAGLGRDFQLAPSARLIAAVGGGTAGGAGAEETTQAAYDPWNYWQFRVGLNGNMNIREQESSYRVNPSLGADRVTENWKINLSTSFTLDRSSRTIPARGETPAREIEDNRDGWDISTLIVKSVGAHVSTGIDFGAGNSVRDNQRARITLAPGIEWNYYPYAETNRRQLIAHYAAGVRYNNYAERTIFGETREALPLHKVGIQYRASEGWGNAGVSLNASQYLHSSGLYSFGASGNLSLRIVRGLDLSLNASGEKIADQIYLPESELSEEDILLGRQSLPTGYSYQFSVGLNYRWGSSFSNIVNSRMQGLGFGGPGGPGGFGGGGGRGGGGFGGF